MERESWLVSYLRTNSRYFQPVIPFRPASQKLVYIDLTSKNILLTENIYTNTNLFDRFISDHIKKYQADYAIGGYDELRVMYDRSSVFDAKSNGDEPRRRHLGIDIWGKAGTPVFCPFQGKVHSVGNNNNDGDYGATVILTHNFEEHTFYTLYGHLSAKDLRLETGTIVIAGEHFASFGEPHENGNWPPHLHFQVIADIENNMGDYPGVCTEKDRQHYLENCPDPDYMLQLNRYCI